MRPQKFCYIRNELGAQISLVIFFLIYYLIKMQSFYDNIELCEHLLSQMWNNIL